MPQESSRFSRREWLMLIAILLLIEYWITTWSYQYSGDQSVLNYISFAATISSILLAVIAIIYGFYQSDSQQQASGRLLAQIDSLRSLASRMSESPVELKAQLDRIDRIANKLDTVDTNVIASNAKLGTIHETIASLRQEIQHLPTKQVTPTGVPPKTMADLASALLNRTSFEADIVACALDRYLKVCKTDQINFDKFLDEYQFAPYKAVAADRGLSLLLGRVHQILTSLYSVGLLTYNDGNYTISSELKSALPAIVAASRQSTQDWVKNVIAKIDEIGA